MDEKQARQVTEEFMRALTDASASADLHYSLRLELGALLPDGAEWAIVPVDGVPRIAALVDRRLIVVGVEHEKTDHDVVPRISADSWPVTAENTTVRLSQSLERDVRHHAHRRRHWSFRQDPPGRELEIETLQRLHELGDGRLPEREQLARAIAAAVGWALPDQDPGVGAH